MAKKTANAEKPSEQRVIIRLTLDNAESLAEAIEKATKTQRKTSPEDQSLVALAAELHKKAQKIAMPPAGGLLDGNGFVAIKLKLAEARALAEALNKAGIRLITAPRSADSGECLQGIAKRLTTEADRLDPRPQRGLATPFGRHALVTKTHG